MANTYTFTRVQIVFFGFVILLLCATGFLLGAVLSEANLSPVTVPLEDGREIVCIASEAGGVNCDWTFVN